MRVLSFPLRVEGGAFSSVEQGSDRQAQQVAMMIVGTRVGERLLGPDFGMFDEVGVGVSRAEVLAAIDLCEPDLQVSDVVIGQAGDRQSVSVTVAWDVEA